MNRRLLTGTVAFACLCLIASESYAWNQPPVAVIKVNGSGLYHNHVVAGEEVEFDGSDSYDYGGEIVQYTWYIFSGGDAEHSSLNEPVMRATFRTGGNVKIRLRVKDNEGAYSYDYCRVYITDLDVDSNRNININYSDEYEEWDETDLSKYAIVLPNCDDDNGDHIPDNWPGEHNIHQYPRDYDPGDWDLDGHENDDPASEVVDGEGDISDLAELWVHQFHHGRFGATFTLEVENPDSDGYFKDVEAHDIIRIFEPTEEDGDDLVIKVGDEEVIGPVTEDNTYSFYCGHSGIIKFGIEGIEPGATVDIKLTVSQEDYDDCVDTVRMRVAPFVLADNSMDIDASGPSNRKTVYVADGAYGEDNNMDLRIELYDVYTNHLDETTDGSHWPWHQDGYDVGYAKAPYGDMQVIIVTPRAYCPWGNNLLAKFAHNDLLNQDDVGVWWGLEDGDTELTYNSTGNIECRPGDSGPGDFLFGQEEDIEDNIKDFFAAQNVNSSLPIDTDWLFVGHADETVSFAPDGQHTIIPDPEVYWGLLLWAHSINPDLAEVLIQPVETGDEDPKYLEVEEVLTDNGIWSYNFGILMAGDALGGIRTQLGLDSPESEPEPDPDNTGTGTLTKGGAFVAMLPAGVNTRTYKIKFDQEGDNLHYRLSYKDNDSGTWTEENNIYGMYYDNQLRYGTGASYARTDAECIFKTAKCFILYHFWEDREDIEEGDEFVFEVNANCNTLEMPVLFKKETGDQWGTQAFAYTINHANCLVDEDRVFTGKTHEENTDDVIINYVKNLFEKAGFDSSKIINPDTKSYHKYVGDVHCATNALRVIPDSYDWWE